MTWYHPPPRILGGPNFFKRQFSWGDLRIKEKSGGGSAFWGDLRICQQILGGPICPSSKNSLLGVSANLCRLINIRQGEIFKILLYFHLSSRYALIILTLIVTVWKITWFVRVLSSFILWLKILGGPRKIFPLGGPKILGGPRNSGGT